MWEVEGCHRPGLARVKLGKEPWFGVFVPDFGIKFPGVDFREQKHGVTYVTGRAL